MVKLFGLTGVVSLLIGGVFALLVALTRWELIGLLSPADFYKYLSVHAWYLLIFWMVFLEIAILYVGGSFVLGRRLPLTTLAKAGYALMIAGVAAITYGLWTQAPPDHAPLLTAYVPLQSPPSFYLGLVLFLLGALVAAVPFLATIWKEKRENPGTTLPLIAFGAFATAIVAAEAILGGLLAFGPTFLWRIGVIEHLDAGWYRQMY